MLSLPNMVMNHGSPAAGRLCPSATGGERRNAARSMRLRRYVARSGSRSHSRRGASSSHRSRFRYIASRAPLVRRNCGDSWPDNPRLAQLSDESRPIVSEPLGDLAGAWNPVPESSYGIVQEGAAELHPFRPRRP